MVAPSKNFTVIPSADTDPDSPITTGLMVALAENDIHLEEWLGDSFVAAKDHNHDDVNSKKVAGANLPFEQSTGNVVSIGVGATVDLATITILAADLTVNRDAMIIASGDAKKKLRASTLVVRLNVAGVVKQSLDALTAQTLAEKEVWALSEIVNLTSGADRIIKVQGVSPAGGADVFGTNLFAVLIT